MGLSTCPTWDKWDKMDTGLTRLTKHITPHANGKPLLKLSSSHSYSFPVTILLVVWSANGAVVPYFQGKFQGQFTMTIFTDRIVQL